MPSAETGSPPVALGNFAAYHAECLLKALAPQLLGRIRLAAKRMECQLVFHFVANSLAVSMTLRPNSCASPFAPSGRGLDAEDTFPFPLSTVGLLVFWCHGWIDREALSDLLTTSSCNSKYSCSSLSLVSDVQWPLLLWQAWLESHSHFVWL